MSRHCHGGELYGFQSTLLMRGATLSESDTESSRKISIHAPHARSDQLKLDQDGYKDVFQSTLLMRGATRFGQTSPIDKIKFQSTLLMRGATATDCGLHVIDDDFNPRSSCEERRCAAAPWYSSGMDFNPRSSCEERLPSNWFIKSRKISIHAPHARSDPD